MFVPLTIESAPQKMGLIALAIWCVPDVPNVPNAPCHGGCFCHLATNKLIDWNTPKPTPASLGNPTDQSAFNSLGMTETINRLVYSVLPLLALFSGAMDREMSVATRQWCMSDVK